MEHQPVRQNQTTTPATTCLYLFDKFVGSLTSPTNHVTLKMKEPGATDYSPYPRRLEPKIICRYNYKSSTQVWSGARTLDLPQSRLALYQLSYMYPGSSKSIISLDRMLVHGWYNLSEPLLFYTPWCRRQCLNVFVLLKNTRQPRPELKP